MSPSLTRHGVPGRVTVSGREAWMRSSESDAPMDPVLRLARLLTTGRGVGSGPEDRSGEDHIATAELVAALLPHARAAAGTSEQEIVSALRALSGTGALVWVGFPPIPAPGNPRTASLGDADGTISADDSAKDRRNRGVRVEEPSSRKPSSFEFEPGPIDVSMLARYLGVGLAGSHSVAPGLLEGPGPTAGGESTSRGTRRELLRGASRRTLEQAWLARTLAREVTSTRSLGRDPAQRAATTSLVIGSCASALDNLLRCRLPRDPYGRGDERHDETLRRSPASWDTPRGCALGEAGALLLAAPAAAGLIRCLEGVLRWSTAFAEGPAWSASALSSLWSPGGVFPALVSLATELVLPAMAESDDDDDDDGGTGDRDGARLQGHQGASRASAARDLARSPGGEAHVPGEMLRRVLGCLQAALSRSTLVLGAAGGVRSPGLEGPPRQPSRAGDTSTPRKTSRAGQRRPRGCCGGIGHGGRDGCIKEGPAAVVVERTNEAARQVLAATAPLVEPEGCLLALLRAGATRLRGRMAPGGRGHGEERSPVRVDCPPHVLASALHLASTYFTLWEAHGAGCGQQWRPESFAAPLLDGLEGCLLRGFAPSGAHETVGRLPEDDPTSPRDDWSSTVAVRGVTLCRRYQDALLDLSGIGDRRLIERWEELGAAEFLLTGIILEGASSPATNIASPGGGEPAPSPRESRPSGTSQGTPAVLVCSPPAGGDSAQGITRPGCGHPPSADRTPWSLPNTDGSNGTTESRGDGIPVQESSSTTVGGETSRRDRPGAPRDESSTAAKSMLSVGETVGGAGVVAKTASSGRGRAAFVPGDQVDGLVSVKAGRPRWFPGRVVGVNDDGSLHVVYEDGDEDMRKAPASVCARRPRARGRRTDRISPGDGSSRTRASQAEVRERGEEPESSASVCQPWGTVRSRGHPRRSIYLPGTTLCPFHRSRRQTHRSGSRLPGHDSTNHPLGRTQALSLSDNRGWWRRR